MLHGGTFFQWLDLVRIINKMHHGKLSPSLLSAHKQSPTKVTRSQAELKSVVIFLDKVGVNIIEIYFSRAFQWYIRVIL